jgi:hypothetical protein
LRQRLEGAQARLAGVATQQNALLESLARNELEQQKERIGTYQIQARFALASIYDRAALGGGAVATPDTATESQGELETVPADTPAPPEAPLDGAPPPPAEQPDAPAPQPEPAATELEPGVNTSAPSPEAPK